MSVRVYTNVEIGQLLFAQFTGRGAWQHPIVMNGRYCAVTRDWVEKPFSRYFFDLLAARDQRRWQKRGNQCEHFALRAALEAVELFRLSEDPTIPAEAESIAVAAVAYQQAGGAWHEVNLWLIEGVWQPWEPQTLKFFTFTEAERRTVCQAIVP